MRRPAAQAAPRSSTRRQQRQRHQDRRGRLGHILVGARYNRYPGLAHNVPANSIDVRYASASAVVPEPGTALLVLGGLLPLLLLKTRATRSR